MWRARRKHLLDHRAAAIVKQGLAADTVDGTETSASLSGPTDPETDPLRAEIRDLLIRGALLVEELFFLLDRRRF
jgi:hypothetical protein